MGLKIDEALKKGVAAHQAGQVQEAGRLYTAVLKAQPKHPDANHNMGVLMASSGKMQKALALFKTALEANPGVSHFWLSYIKAHVELGNVNEAKSVYRQARDRGAKGEAFDSLAAKLNDARSDSAKGPQNQDPAQNQLQSLINLYNQGQFQKTLAQSRKLQQQFPNSLMLYNIIGAANRGLKQFDAAIDNFQQAIRIEPDFAEAYYNMGNALRDKGAHEAAIESYRQAIRIQPDYAEAYYNMGNALKDKGAYEAAIEGYLHAITVEPDYAEVYYSLAFIIRGLTFEKPIPGLANAILALLKKQTYVRPRNVVATAIRLLKLDPIIKAAIESWGEDRAELPLNQTISDLAGIPLLLELMSVCPLPDLEFEIVLTKIRAEILHGISGISATADTLTFQSALALQCFTNEYLYNQTEAETQALEGLQSAVESGLSNGKQPDPSALLCLASYKALHEYPWHSLLTFPAELETLERRQILEFAEEERIRSEIPVLQEITRRISTKVREQYEENPYPRWVQTGLLLRAKPISQITSELNLRLADAGVNKIEAPQILVAGCGTGQHAIFTASRFKDCSVLAIDLSLSSLAYAKRKAEELGITNIEFWQADILDLENLDRQFDIVESAGVLHHMENPMAGWTALANCLKPAGLMMIGLYSELARQHIVKLRDEIAQSDVWHGNVAMKTLRTKFINSDQEHHKNIRSSPDFYSLSTLRDLLFHVQEHRFTIPQICDCLDELGLAFCGFEKERITNAFKSWNPDEDALYDLGKWSEFEQANPRTFAGMYQFWCQKVNQKQGD